MRPLRLFLQHAPNRTFVAVVCGALSGLLYALLIPVVIRAVSDDELSYVVKDKIVEVFGLEIAHSRFAAFFLCLCLLILIFKTISDVLLCRILLDVRFKLRQALYRRIQDSPIASLESVGEAKLMQSLSGDVSSIVLGAQLLPELIANAVVLIGMLGYLAYLDFHAFLYVVEVVGFGIVTYRVPVLFGVKQFRRVREYEDELQIAFRGLIGGAKELRLSAEKSDLYERNVLLGAESRIRAFEVSGRTIFSVAGNYGNLIGFFAIGGLAFVFVNYRQMNIDETIAAVMVLLYITSPIAALLNFIPQIARARIALQKINRLYEDLPGEGVSSCAASPMGEWETLRFCDVVYRHREIRKDVRAFEVGPVSLDIQRGSVVFITGGNGSGKTTLAKIISQHYLPTGGRILVGDRELNRSNIASFRGQISCIYSDYYVFEQLLSLGSGSSACDETIRAYLKAFDLGEKIEINDGRFSTLNLSDGQRRRLAMVVAIAEQKSLYVFDEWAADQDPQFKRIFYYEILPFLKQKNCAVVVISHDDRYFNVADRVIVMDSGRLVENAQPLVSRENNRNESVSGITVFGQAPCVNRGDQIAQEGSSDGRNSRG